MAEWEKTADNIKPMINDNSIWKQIGYISNESVDCEPILLSEKHDNDFYPIVIKEPAELNKPKYDWAKHMWVDQDATSNSVRLTNAEKAIQLAQEQAKTVSTENQTLKDTLNNIERGQKDQTQTLANVVQMMAPLLAPKTDNGGSTNA